MHRGHPPGTKIHLRIKVLNFHQMMMTSLRWTRTQIAPMNLKLALKKLVESTSTNKERSKESFKTSVIILAKKVNKNLRIKKNNC